MVFADIMTGTDKFIQNYKGRFIEDIVDRDKENSVITVKIWFSGVLVLFS